MYESKASLMGVMPFNINTLINYQALLVGNLVGVPLCYFIIRTLRNPLHLRGYYQQLKLQIDSKATKKRDRYLAGRIDYTNVYTVYAID